MRAATGVFVLLAISCAANVVSAHARFRLERRSDSPIRGVPDDHRTDSPNAQYGSGSNMIPSAVTDSGGSVGVASGSQGKGAGVGVNYQQKNADADLGGGSDGLVGTRGSRASEQGLGDDKTKDPISDGGLPSDDDQASTPLPVTHGDYGSYPNSGSAFQQFYAFSPWVYVSSKVATGAQKAGQPSSLPITLGVCRCERPIASFADGNAPAKTVNYDDSVCLANVLAASSNSAQCQDAGIDQKQCIENGVLSQLEAGDKLWWQKTFCKRCVDAGGISDPQFACFDGYPDANMDQDAGTVPVGHGDPGSDDSP